MLVGCYYSALNTNLTQIHVFECNIKEVKRKRELNSKTLLEWTFSACSPHKTQITDNYVHKEDN